MAGMCRLGGADKGQDVAQSSAPDTRAGHGGGRGHGSVGSGTEHGELCVYLVIDRAASALGRSPEAKPARKRTYSMQVGR